MSTIRFNPPLMVDLTAYLAVRGVDVPRARIKIYSAYWQGRALAPGNCYYMLGENGWRDKIAFAAALKNYAEAPLGVFARDHWHFNQLTASCQAAIERHQAHAQTA